MDRGVVEGVSERLDRGRFCRFFRAFRCWRLEFRAFDGDQRFHVMFSLERRLFRGHTMPLIGRLSGAFQFVDLLEPCAVEIASEAKVSRNASARFGLWTPRFFMSSL